MIVWILHCSSETKQDIVPSASNPEAVTDIESPYYEEMDLHHVHEEPQYETLDEYDKLPSSTCADKIPWHSQTMQTVQFMNQHAII